MPEIKTYADNPAVAAEFAKYLCDWINAQTQDKITVSLSGGSTPKLLFQVLANDFAPVSYTHLTLPTTPDV